MTRAADPHRALDAAHAEAMACDNGKSAKVADLDLRTAPFREGDAP
jgi:hypothetical protein